MQARLPTLALAAVLLAAPPLAGCMATVGDDTPPTAASLDPPGAETPFFWSAAQWKPYERQSTATAAPAR